MSFEARVSSSHCFHAIKQTMREPGMSEVKMAFDLSDQNFFETISVRTEKQVGLSVDEETAMTVLSAEELAFAVGGLLTRKVNEYEGQHR